MKIASGDKFLVSNVVYTSYKHRNQTRREKYKFQTAQKLFERVDHPLMYYMAEYYMVERASSFELCFFVTFLR